MPENSHSYHFDFIKDRFWMWALVLPLGFVSWVVPIVVLFGLISTGMEESTSAVIALLFLGVPSYLIGWIFVYSFMEGIITRVTFTDTEIRHRTPAMILPLFWVTKKILVEKIENIHLNVPYGTRTAIYLYYRKGNKRRKFYLPRFKNQPNYLEEFRAINNRLPQPSDMVLSEGSLRTEEEVKTNLLVAARSKRPAMRVWDGFVKSMTSFFIFVEVFGSGYICLQLPYSTVAAFTTGMTGGFVCIFMSLIASIPVIGQILIWIFARKLINMVFWFFGVKPDTLFLPSAWNNIIQGVFGSTYSQLSLTDFIFWIVFLLSILFSMDRIIRWTLRRRKPEKKNNNISE